MAKDLPSATVDDRNEYAPTIPSTVDQGKIGGPALIWIGGNRGGGFDARAMSRTALGQRPTFPLHDAVHLFAVDLDALDEAQTTPCSTDTTCGFFLVDAFDAGGHRLIQRPWDTLARLVISAGSGTRPSHSQSLLVDKSFPDASKMDLTLFMTSRRAMAFPALHRRFYRLPSAW